MEFTSRGNENVKKTLATVTRMVIGRSMSKEPSPRLIFDSKATVGFIMSRIRLRIFAPITFIRARLISITFTNLRHERDCGVLLMGAVGCVSQP